MKTQESRIPQYSTERPKLIPSVVLYFDLLASREMATSPNAQAHLDRLCKALDEAEDFGLHRDFQPYILATFTDHIALGWPMSADGEVEMAGIVDEAAWYQFSLSRNGFLARGGLAVGDAYFRQDFAFGRGLVSAYDLEQAKPGHPRVVLDANSLALIQMHCRYYGGVDRSPSGSSLLVDDQHTVFINYFCVINDDEMDGTEEYAIQRRLIENGIAKYSSDTQKLGKYLWLADLYNHNNRRWHTPRLIASAPNHFKFHRVSTFLE